VSDGGYIDGPERHLTPDANQCSAKGCTRTVTLVSGCDTLCEPHRKDPPNGFETIEADTDDDLVTDGGHGDGTDRVEQILDEHYGDRVYSVEDGVVWVSGINANCASIARRMAKDLAHGYDIPAGLVYDDGAARFGGVQFNWGESA